MRQILQTLLLGATLACMAPLAAQEVPQGPKNVPGFAPAFDGQTRAPQATTDVALDISPIAEGLEHPWGIALLPDGTMLVTERPGRLRLIGADGTLARAPVRGLPPVREAGQGGLLDVTVSPTFAEDRLVFWTYAKPMEGSLSATAVGRGRLSDDMTTLTDVADIFVQTPPSATPRHYGARLVFDGPDTLFVTTGERSSPDTRGLAQDLGAAYGKVLRIRTDGSIPPDNPFVGRDGALGAIWSYGHRNIQGAALDPRTGTLWISEHGPRGGDELNRVTAGANYGWPVITYGEEYNATPIGAGLTAAEGMEQPVYYWDPVIAPSGMLFYDGALFPEWQGNLLIASLAPGGVMRLDLGDSAGGAAPRVVAEERLLPDAGRIRDVEMAPDGALLVLTDARDGAVLRVTPAGPRRF